ncbi:MAG: efflux RND transporter periplasmic adaptor subunit [Saprospirales bacterium]|nr:efflux RND transporter periplasmic adaptor subunit [Saprospirales bacterium]
MKPFVVPILASLLLGVSHFNCQNPGQAAHVHEEEVQELEALAYTLYTEKTELFVEFKPLVAGQEGRFAAHFTALGEFFIAIGEGSVTLSLSNAENDQRVTADSPEVPGIFRLRLTPEKPGLFRLVFDIKTPEYSDQIVIDSIAVFPDMKAALAAQSSGQGASNEISYLKEQAWKIDFANQPVRRKEFARVVKTSGVFLPSPGGEETVVAKTSGLVSLAGSGLFAGSLVKQGQVLFTVSSQKLTDRNTPLQIREAASELARARADFERNQKLFDERLLVEKDYLQSKNALENAEARLASLSGNYEPGGQLIRAGRQGYLKSLLVADGQYVETGTPLAVLSENKRLSLRVDLSPTVYQKAGAIASANFKFADGKLYSLQELNGRLVSIGKSAEQTMFIPVFFEVDNRQGIFPGAYVEAFLQTNAQTRALVIPLSAILEEQGNYYCYIQTAGESFEKREIRPGGNDGKEVEVLSGVREGERVVTKGAYNIKLATASGTLPAHGHEH